MTELIDNIQRIGNRFPLLLQLSSRLNPQDCGFELNVRTGEISLFVDNSAEPVPPTPVFPNMVLPSPTDKRLVLRFNVNPYASMVDILGLAESKKDYFQAILDGVFVSWSGVSRQYVGELSNEAQCLIADWKQKRLGDIEGNKPIVVAEIMKEEGTPTTVVGLNALIDKLIGFDREYGGGRGFYAIAPTRAWIEEKLMNYLIDKYVSRGKALSAEIANYILDNYSDVYDFSFWLEELENMAEAVI